MDGITVKIRAKINLSLNITGTEGSYHALESVMTSVSLFDTVTAKKRTDGKLHVSFSGGDVENSNAEKAARIMTERFKLTGADIFIEQNIPSGGGVGGSSADAAGVIRALEALYGVKTDRSELEGIAAVVGSDVPFMLSGGVALVTGRGEKIKRLEATSGLKLLLAWRRSVNTKACFNAFDACGEDGIASNTEALIRALERGDETEIRKNVGNALEKSAIGLEPDIARTESIMRRCGLTAMMTGSGACVFGIGSDEQLAAALEGLEIAGITAVIVKTEKCGYEIV